MVFLLSIILLVLVGIHIIVLINITRGPFLARFNTPSREPRVTALIPARNEEENISACLTSLCGQTYRNLEIICYDDQSTDRTAELARSLAEGDRRITVIDGIDVPRGWTGKNWACYQLSRHASGEILLFVDADVRAGKRAVESTVAALEQMRADALSAFPEQHFTTLSARVVVPMMDVLLYSFLPLPLVHRSRYESLVAANGQWLAFTRTAYERIGTHEAVRDHLVEDMALARRVKRNGLTMLLTCGVGSVACSMYANLREVVRGFSKNFFAAFDHSILKFAPILVLFGLVFVTPFVLLPFFPHFLVLIAAVLNFSFRFLLAGRMKHGLLSALLHPLGALIAVLIGLNAIRVARLRGGVKWKGRTIEI